MFCQHCGHELPAEAKFCQNCGKQIGQTSSEVATGEKPVSKQKGKRVTWKQKWQKKKKWQKIAGVIGLIIGLTWAFSDAYKGYNNADQWYGNNDPVAFVQQSYLDGYPDKTVGEAVKDFFGETTWWSLDSDDDPNRSNVFIEGQLNYNDQPAKSVLNISVDKRRETFEIVGLMINEVGQSHDVINQVLKEMYK